MTRTKTTIRHPSFYRGGFTLLEALLASVILAIATSAIVVPYAAGAQNDVTAARRAIAASLAQELMEEIVAKPFSDPDDGSQTVWPEAGESNRTLYDNVDDYGGYTDAAGTLTSDPLAAQLSRSADVAYVYVNGQDAGEPTKFARATVRVKRGTDTLVTLTRLVYCNE